jgi:hypothetical protein
LKAATEKEQITYKGKPIKIQAHFSMETLKVRRAWSEVFQALNENNFNPGILYPAKLSFITDGAMKIFHNKQKLKQYMTTQPYYMRFSLEICTQKVKANKIMKGWEVSNHRRKKTGTQRVAMIQLHTIKPLNNKNN